MAERQTQVLEASAYLDAKVPSVHVVAQEQIASGAGGSAHLEKLHQVKELAVDVATHWTQTYRRVGNVVQKRERHRDRERERGGGNDSAA